MPEIPPRPLPATAGSCRSADSHATSLGLRIATLRGENGWTQAELAARVAISRVALSNLELSRSVPGERTVTLLAGVFGMEPHELVAGTDYPAAKADRLPLVAARYTEAALQLALLERDLRWLETAPPRLALDIVTQWQRRLRALLGSTHDQREAAQLRVALDDLAALVVE